MKKISISILSKVRNFFLSSKITRYLYEQQINRNIYNKYLLELALRDKNVKKYLFDYDTKREATALAIVQHLGFDSKIFDMPSARVSFFFSRESRQAAVQYNWSQRLIKEAVDYLKSIGSKYIICRLNPECIFLKHPLEEANFRLLDALVKFNIDLNKYCSSKEDSCVEVRCYKRSDLPYLERIASEVFIYDRFHSDNFLPKDKSDYLHKLWIKNICLSNHDDIFVAVKNNKPVGFLSLTEDFILKKVSGLRVFSITLVAVALNYQNRGIGRVLICHALDNIKDKADICEVGTQINNIPACRTYESLGFKVFSSNLTFRRWMK